MSLFSVEFLAGPVVQPERLAVWKQADSHMSYAVVHDPPEAMLSSWEPLVLLDELTLPDWEPTL